MKKRQIVQYRGCPIPGVVLALFLILAPACALAEPASGIVVEEARPGMTAQRAGLQSGDILLSWHREASSTTDPLPTAGALDLPFDLADVLIEQVPRGTVVLEGTRAGLPMSWKLPAGAPSDLRAIRTAPVRLPEALTQDRLARAGVDSDIRSSISIWRAAATAARERRDPEVATWLLSEAAHLVGEKGLWGDADTLYSEALSAQEALEDKHYIAAQVLRAWGDLFKDRFSWDRAEDCFNRALAADRQKPYESLSAALSLLGLGYIDNLSAGPKDDRHFFRQALEIRQRLAPGSCDDALSWYHLGTAALFDSQWANAIESYQQSVERLEKLDAAPLSLAEVLLSLALVQFRHGDFEAAEKTWLKNLELLQKAAPDDFMLVGTYQGLGLIERRKGNRQRSEELLAKSMEICHRLEPGSLHEVDALFELGRAQSRAGKWAAASRHLCQAVDLVEDWRKKFQGDVEMRSRWGKYFADYYRDCADTLVHAGHEEDAFLVLEKGRARAFLDLSAERNFRQATLPPGRAQEWKKLDAEYDQTQAMIERFRSKAKLEETVNLEGRLLDIRRKKERLLAEARLPGSIQYPEPLSLAEARRRLEPGSVLLYYSVGETKTLLYVLSSSNAQPPGWTVLTLDIEAAALKKRVDSYRKLLIEGRADQRDLRVQGRALHDLLIRPAEPYLSGAERIVISPDGPLHVLPFSALPRQDQYLIEWKPLHFVLSATAYADLLARRPPEHPPWKLVAFGDPAVPRAARGESKPPETLLRMGLRNAVAPLPAARKEVEGIASLFKDSRVFLGDEVTENRVKEAARDASLVHFAVHGLLNERSPLNSGLILSPSKETGVDRNNGLLQAWEVMEEIPLNADLVTLSACDTALGREVGGEGLIGLTRAFQYAGARSVIGTLWGISDRSTSGLMMALYEALREGESKDEALREAQIAQIRSGKPQPFYWAGFQLFGDWR